MKRSNGPRRKKSLRKKNPERTAKLFAKHFGTSLYVQALHKEGCSVPGCRPTSASRAKIECDHNPTRGSGRATWRDMAPLCAYHHRIKGDLGLATFESFYGIEMAAINAAMVLQHGHLAEHPPYVIGVDESDDGDRGEWTYVNMEDC